MDSYSIILENIGDSFCSEEETVQVMKMVGMFIYVFKMLVPLMIIGFASYDLFKVVREGDTKAISAAAKNLGIKCLAGIMIFFLPTLLDAIFKTISSYQNIASEYYVCANCLFDPTNDSCSANTENPFDGDLLNDSEDTTTASTTSFSTDSDDDAVTINP